jgi:hypothetical protein
MIFLLFSGSFFYADGGWFDYKGSYSSIDEAVGEIEGPNIKSSDKDWWHIVDSRTRQIVKRSHPTD